MEPFDLPEGLLLGSATSAIQIEGGDWNNDWVEWAQSGYIKDGSSSLRAADHWNRVEEDVFLLSEMKHEIYRMGLEWSRIEPEEGIFDDLAIAHYRKELQLLTGQGIRPLVTLHHFSIPLWFSRMGGFESKRAPELFEAYVRCIVSRIGDIANEFITINEPNVLVTNGYYRGIWPPGKKDFKVAMDVYANLARCHSAAYRAIHQTRSQLGFSGVTRVGAAFHVRIFSGATERARDRIAAKAMDYLFQGMAMKAMIDGYLAPPMGFGPVDRGWRRRGGTRTSDFLALNYYTRSIVKAKGFREATQPDSPQNDLGWEIYPEGLEILCRKLYKKYGLPVWITENGTCDNNDVFRSEFIVEHLRRIAAVCKEGIPVERYYHWSAFDNFEWLEGESARFGLVHVDFATQKRTIKESGLRYRRIIEERAVKPDRPISFE